MKWLLGTEKFTVLSRNGPQIGEGFLLVSYGKSKRLHINKTSIQQKIFLVVEVTCLHDYLGFTLICHI